MGWGIGRPVGPRERRAVAWPRSARNRPRIRCRSPTRSLAALTANRLLMAPLRTAAPAAADDPLARLMRAKQMLDAGLITQADYDAVKAKALGL